MNSSHTGQSQSWNFFQGAQFYKSDILTVPSQAEFYPKLSDFSELKTV